MAQTLSPVGNPISLEKLAYDTLKDAILTFRLKPGESLVESDLAHQLGISKTPVRDALLRLEKEGFIIKIPYKGYYVMEITRQSVEDMFEIRAVLEGLAARLAVSNFSAGDIQAALQILQEHEQAEQAGNIQYAAQLNRQFHDLIIRRSGNARLEAMLSNLDDHIQRYRTLSNYQSGRLQKSVEEHRRVLDAIQRGDPDAAEQAIRAHILSVMGDLENQNIQDLILLATRPAS